MQAILKEPQRVVNYFGLDLVVPPDTNYLATNYDGTVVACVCQYRNTPIIDRQRWSVNYDSNEDCIVIATVDINGIDWKSTLQKV